MFEDWISVAVMTHAEACCFNTLESVADAGWVFKHKLAEMKMKRGKTHKGWNTTHTAQGTSELLNHSFLHCTIRGYFWSMALPWGIACPSQSMVSECYYISLPGTKSSTLKLMESTHVFDHCSANMLYNWWEEVKLKGVTPVFNLNNNVWSGKASQNYFSILHSKQAMTWNNYKFMTHI